MNLVEHSAPLSEGGRVTSSIARDERAIDLQLRGGFDENSKQKPWGRAFTLTATEAHAVIRVMQSALDELDRTA